MTDRPKLYVYTSEPPKGPVYPRPTKKWEFVMAGGTVTVVGRRGDLDYHAALACLRHALRAMDRPDLLSEYQNDSWQTQLHWLWVDFKNWLLMRLR